VEREVEREVERWEYAFLRFGIGGLMKQAQARFTLTYSHRDTENLDPTWTTEAAFRHLADQGWELVTATAVAPAFISAQTYSESEYVFRRRL